MALSYGNLPISIATGTRFLASFMSRRPLAEFGSMRSRSNFFFSGVSAKRSSKRTLAGFRSWRDWDRPQTESSAFTIQSTSGP